MSLIEVTCECLSLPLQILHPAITPPKKNRPDSQKNNPNHGNRNLKHDEQQGDKKPAEKDHRRSLRVSWINVLEVVPGQKQSPLKHNSRKEKGIRDGPWQIFGQQNQVWNEQQTIGECLKEKSLGQGKREVSGEE
jgi:hypothetical protein